MPGKLAACCGSGGPAPDAAALTRVTVACLPACLPRALHAIIYDILPGATTL